MGSFKCHWNNVAWWVRIDIFLIIHVRVLRKVVAMVFSCSESAGHTLLDFPLLFRGNIETNKKGKIDSKIRKKRVDRT